MKAAVIVAVIVLTACGSKPASFPADPKGERMLEQGRYKEAADHFKHEYRKDRNNMTACMGLGQARCAQGKMDEAIKTLNQCIERHPERPEVFVSRGVCEQTGKDGDDDAIADFIKALALDPANGPAHNQMGAILQRRGEQGKAIEHFQAAIAADPKDFAPYNNLGISELALGRYPQAVTAFQEALQRQTDLSGLHVYANLGIALLHMKKFAQAESCFLMEASINPDYVPARLYLGNLYALSGRYPEAVEAFATILSYDPDNLDALINIAAVRLSTDAPTLAVAPLQRAIKAHPDSGMAYYYLGRVYEAMGDQGNAVLMQQKAGQLGFDKNSQPSFLMPTP